MAPGTPPASWEVILDACSPTRHNVCVWDGNNVEKSVIKALVSSVFVVSFTHMVYEVLL